MSSSIRACVPLAALLLLAAVGSAQVARRLSVANEYIPPKIDSSNNQNKICPGDRTLTTTLLQEVTTTVTRVQYSTVKVVSTIQQERVQVQPTTQVKTERITVTQPIVVRQTKTFNKVVYNTRIQVVPGKIRVVVSTEYVPKVRTLFRTSVVTVPQYVTRQSVSYVTVTSTVTSAGPRPTTPVIYITETTTLRGPVVVVTSTKTVPNIIYSTVPSPAIVKTVHDNKLVTIERVVQRYSPDVQRTTQVQVTQVQYVTSTQRVTKTSQVVVDVTSTVRNTVTKYRTSTVVQPVQVVSTQHLINTITKTNTIFVTEPVYVTTTRTVASTAYGPAVVRIAYNSVTQVVTQPGSIVTVTSVSNVVRVITQRVTSTAVVQRYTDRTVEVSQPCGGYNYADKGNPLNI